MEDRLFGGMPLSRSLLTVGDVQLCVVDFGGQGQDALLLHGLAGRGAEWHQTAQWLRTRRHVIALDQRGHGRSTKGCRDVSRDAFVADVIAVIERRATGPVLLVGQSLGGLIAFHVAARRPDLVDALIVAEATPERSPAAPEQIRRWLDGWPLPFPTLADARAFFGGDTLYAHTWLEVLEERDDGYWPQFDPNEMVAVIADVAARDSWAEWQQVRCPTLLVGAEHGFFDAGTFAGMSAVNPHAQVVMLPGARHDLHLDQPDAWQAAVIGFLDTIDHHSR